jgi:signal transduction histidine kinase
VRVKLRLARWPGAFPAGSETGDLEAFGSRALDAVGVRLAQVFLVTVLFGVPLASSPHHLGQALITGFGTALCAAGVAYVLLLRRGRAWLVALVVLTGLTVALLAGAKADFGPDRTQDLAAWVVAGMASGIATSRGPGWGIAVFVPAVVAELVAEQAHGGLVFAPVLLGALTYYVGGAVTNVLARRGFATTEQALEAVAGAEAARQVAEERWRARREADRLLHDTVLATLAVLAHSGEGASPAELRAACRRDLGLLGRGHEEAGRQPTARPEPGPGLEPANGPEPGPGPETGVAALVEAARGEAARRGLALRAHAAALEQPGLHLDPAVATALRQALVECVANVRHARVRHLDLMASVADAALVLVVLDEGQGFDQARVPADRLGLRASVQERITAVGGGVTIWSQPRQGTSVMLRVPLARP